MSLDDFNENVTKYFKKHWFGTLCSVAIWGFWICKCGVVGLFVAAGVSQLSRWMEFLGEMEFTGISTHPAQLPPVMYCWMA